MLDVMMMTALRKLTVRPCAMWTISIQYGEQYIPGRKNVHP